MSYPRKSAFRTKIQSGDRFGQLKVVERKGTNSRRAIVWSCVCDCGKITTALTNDLTRGSKQSCGCLRIQQLYERSYKGTKDIPAVYWRQILRNAKQRNIEVEVNQQDLQKLFDQQYGKCGLTGVSLSFHSWNPTSKKYEGGTASLDRMNSTRGYQKDNLMWIHKDLNKMKGDFDIGTFIALCESVSLQSKNAQSDLHQH